MWLSTSVLTVIWGGLLGQWSTEAISTSVGKDEAGQLEMCTMVHRYIFQGITASIPITLPNNYSVLCKVNFSTSDCDWILISDGTCTFYFLKELQDRLTLYHRGLAVIGMSEELEGEYQVLSVANATCEFRVLLRNIGPWFLCQIFLVAFGISMLVGLVARMLSKWLFKACNRLTASQEVLRTNENIPLVITPS